MDSVSRLEMMKTKTKEEKRMLRIVFEYRDRYCFPKWNQQECTVSSVEECKRIYGLGVDCEYKIISVEEVK